MKKSLSLAIPLPNNFIDYAGKGKDAVPADTLRSSLIALNKLGLDCRFDVFRNQALIGGALLTEVSPAGEGSDIREVSDPIELGLREYIAANFDFEPSARMMHDAVMRACHKRSFHPIKDYFAGLPAWDGEFRAERLLTDYFNAPDTPFNGAVSRVVMMASVRRILIPGTKFDYTTVLQSEEGYNKSTAIETLYGEENYTDATTIGLSRRDTEEVLRGHWVQESPEMQGISKADWNKFKAQQSTRNDRVRRVYDRNEVNSKRTCIQWGTSNDSAYLRAMSGMNRRFFSVDVLSPIDISKLIADRDQLWAEALLIEAEGDSCMLPEKFWPDANAERLKRTEHDPWEDVLRKIGEPTDIDEDAPDPTDYEAIPELGEERVSSSYCFEVLDFLAGHQRLPHHGSHIGRVMRKLGWSGPIDIRIGKVACKGYRRAPWD
jgi:hypothetical protein